MIKLKDIKFICVQCPIIKVARDFSFHVGHRHVQIIGSDKRDSENKISNDISDRTCKQGL